MAAPKEETEETVTLKQWMKKEAIFDNDILAILTEQGVESPDDFKNYTTEQWDELKRRGAVERAAELKDQKAKLQLEKKMTKIEKFWRKESGIKSTSVKKKKKKKADDEKEAPPLQNSAQAQKDALAKGAGLKKYLQKNQCYMLDLLMVCVNMDICTEDDITKIEDNEAYDEILRQVRVARAKELKDNAARLRMEKQMTKFEKLWREKTGVKKTSVQKGGGKKKKKKHPKDASAEAMAANGAALKQWMRKNDVWEMALYNELMAQGITEADALADVDQQKFDDIVRKVRVDRFSQLKDTKARQRADKLLVKFEKEWRKKSGIKSTSIKKWLNEGVYEMMYCLSRFALFFFLLYFDRMSFVHWSVSIESVCMIWTIVCILSQYVL